ncbi:GAF domain-containing protein [Spinactinospora alkalitolerans]|uniref:GAF domain-containing protein n=1 Tax=Spinactinospora alkalitolerans TaxID=687207 RepID=A0A852U2S3_9ACTN|nr:GAF and ANTAR domain-containing protein [Spinactinospora alkalitolerans]NYE49233.1 GAF domain-containing protein [Spinactinospora alkalitolerans]
MEPDTQMARLFAEMARELAAQEALDKTLEQTVRLAAATVPGCEYAGVSILGPGKRLDTPACTASVVIDCDRIQYELGEGPCVQAAREEVIVVQVDDLVSDPRWPRFAARAGDLGIGSVLSCQLSTSRGTLGSLNLYAAGTKAFDAASREVAVIYAAHAGIALASIRLESALRSAISSRQTIGEAMGVLMERHRISARQSFEMLSQASQNLNIKLRDIAGRVAHTGVDPGRLTRDDL